MASGTEMLVNAALTTVFKALGLNTPEKQAEIGALVAQAQTLPAKIAAYEQRQVEMLDELRSQGETIRKLMVERSADRLKDSALQSVLDRSAMKPIVKTAINSDVYEDYLMETAGPAAFGAAWDMLDDPLSIGFGKPPNSADAIAESSANKEFARNGGG